MARNHQHDVDEYLTAVLDRDEGRARRLVQQMLARGMGMAAIFDVLSSAQVRVGELWERGVISVSDEHFATKTTLECVDLVSEHLAKFRRRSRGTALLCTVEGEYHEVGLRMFSELLREQGWETDFLGSRSSFPALLEHAKRRGGVDLLCISATMPSSLPALISMLKRIRAEPLFSRTKIVVGGSVFRSRRARNSLLPSPSAAGLADSVSERHAPALRYTASLRPAG